MGKTFRKILTIAIAIATIVTAVVAPIGEMNAKAAVVNNVITGGSGTLSTTLTTGEKATVKVEDCRLTAQVNNSIFKFFPVKSTGQPSAIVTYATIADDDLLHIIVHSGEYYVIDLRAASFARYDVYRSLSTQKYCRANAADAYRVFGSVITTTVWFKEVFEGTDDRVTAKLVRRPEFEENTDHTPTPTTTYYTVVFKDYDGRVISTQSIEQGHSATAPANPSRSGYTFTGWSAAFNNIQSNMDIIAQYSKNHEDCHCGNSGCTCPGDCNCQPGCNCSYCKHHTGCNCGNSGCTCPGDCNCKPGCNCSYCKPAPQITYYTVNFKDFDGRLISTQNVEKGKSATAPANPTRSGYTFTGWDKAYNNIQSNLDVYAQYKQNAPAHTGCNCGNSGCKCTGDCNCQRGCNCGKCKPSGSSASANTSAQAGTSSTSNGTTTTSSSAASAADGNGSAAASASAVVNVTINNSGWFVRNHFSKKSGYITKVTLHKQSKGKVCTVQYNSKTKVAKFDGITYTNIKDVTYTQGSRQIIMLTKKGEVWIIPRAKGKIGKTWKKRVIKGKWKSISRDNQGFAIRIVRGKANNPIVKGVVNAQPKQIKGKKK